MKIIKHNGVWYKVLDNPTTHDETHQHYQFIKGGKLVKFIHKHRHTHTKSLKLHIHKHTASQKYKA